MILPLFPTAGKKGNPPSLVAKLQEARPGFFGDNAAALLFLKLIYYPASRRWRYQLNGKSGNTFILNLLFELEFGSRFTCRLTQTDNQHIDFALFQLPAARLLSNALAADDDVATVLEFPGLSIATVRNPYSRASSGFRYLCLSHAVGDWRFLPERLRLNALTGFDWESDVNTPCGFGKFLDYLVIMAEAEGPEKLDPHWMPQHLHIRPEIYKPDLVGKTEDLFGFATELAERLDQPLPDLGTLKTNRGVQSNADLYGDKAMARIVRQLYARDFEVFGYDASRNDTS